MGKNCFEKTHNYTINSNWRWRPCLANELATKLAPYELLRYQDSFYEHVWWSLIESSNSKDFHCHYYTIEPHLLNLIQGSNLHFLSIHSIEKSWLAYVSQVFQHYLFPIKGIRGENMHMKFPKWFLKTPLIAEQDLRGLTNTSTFHLIMLRLGGTKTR